MPERLKIWFENIPGNSLFWWLALGLACFLVAIVIWQVFGRGPRIRRGLRRAHQRFQEGAWEQALQRAHRLRPLVNRSAFWKKRLGRFEADCLQIGCDLALEQKKFEDALEYSLRGAEVLGLPDGEVRAKIQEAMLEEVRRLFSAGGPEGESIYDLLGRILAVQSPCREASFWQGLCHLREGKLELAVAFLENARGCDFPHDSNPNVDPEKRPPLPAFIDPSLYLGALYLRQDQPKTALYYLTEANRIDSHCPLVTLLLGSAMIAAGSDAQLAVRALQRSLGPRGLGLWGDQPHRTWAEAFPEKRSYVRKLAAMHSYTCPIWGADLHLLVRQGSLALAQGLFKLGRFQEAADLFHKVYQEGVPTVQVLRGLGLSLARMGNYDGAFKHLRMAQELEDDRLTAGYLALCGARAKPLRPEDKAQNLQWALRLLARFTAPADPEWISLAGAIFSEARDHNFPLTLDDQIYLCEHLLSCAATDQQAAMAFQHLMATFPDAVRPEYAWLFCRAATLHKIESSHAISLFVRAYSDQVQARAFFEGKGWDFEDMEYAFLKYAAAHEPGKFPEVLGPDYPTRGEGFLLSRSQQEEQAGELDSALATVQILTRLAPASSRALDRLAYLNHCLGNPQRALEILDSWHQHHPEDPWPLIRQAILHQQQGDLERCRNCLNWAMSLNHELPRAEIAFLGARLMLQGVPETGNGQSDHPAGCAPSGRETWVKGRDFSQAKVFLQTCLQANTNHPQASWVLAAVRWLEGDEAGLAEQAQTMDCPDITDPRFHFFRALCCLAGGDYEGTLRGVQSVRENGNAETLRAEASYLSGLAHLGMNNYPGAAEALLVPAQNENSPSVRHAHALLGLIRYRQGQHEEAAHWWHNLDPKSRAVWKVNESLAGTYFLTALEALANQRYEEAAERLRTAGHFGCRDRKLGLLLHLALFKAGQIAFYS